MTVLSPQTRGDAWRAFRAAQRAPRAQSLTAQLREQSRAAGQWLALADTAGLMRDERGDVCCWAIASALATAAAERRGIVRFTGSEEQREQQFLSMVRRRRARELRTIVRRTGMTLDELGVAL